jgi:invasion protein IalB
MRRLAIEFDRERGRFVHGRLRVFNARHYLCVGLIASLLAGTASIAFSQPAKPPAPSAPAQSSGDDGAQFIYSPWAKFCGKGKDPTGKETQLCFTGRDSRTAGGQPVAAVALLESDSQAKRILRVTVPNPVQLQYGTRVLIDQNQPQVSQFWICFNTGCLADAEIAPDTLAKMKSGQTLSIQVINLAGQEITYSFSLADFKKANEGAPSDPNAVSEQQQKLRDELQRKAEEARKQLETTK